MEEDLDSVQRCHHCLCLTHPIHYCQEILEKEATCHTSCDSTRQPRTRNVPQTLLVVFGRSMRRHSHSLTTRCPLYQPPNIVKVCLDNKVCFLDTRFDNDGQTTTSFVIRGRKTKRRVNSPTKRCTHPVKYYRMSNYIVYTYTRDIQL